MGNIISKSCRTRETVTYYKNTCNPPLTSASKGRDSCLLGWFPGEFFVAETPGNGQARERKERQTKGGRGYTDMPLRQLKRASRERKETPQWMGVGWRCGGGEMSVGKRISRSEGQVHGDHHESSEEEIRWVTVGVHFSHSYSCSL